jgi:hypothetical protein
MILHGSIKGSLIHHKKNEEEYYNSRREGVRDEKNDLR